MKMLPPTLRQPALWFAAVLVVGSSVFYLALDARMDARTRQLAAQAAASQAARDLQLAPERLAEAKEQADTFAQLRDKGFLGAEDRLDWLGSLARLRHELNLQQVTWRLSPRAPSSLSPGLSSSAMVVVAAPLDPRRMALFLARLREQAHGRFTVRECTLQPDAGGNSASCTLDWWTWNGQ